MSASAVRPVRSTPLERVLVLGQRLGQVVADGADLQHDHADRVGDDVVQLARDPRALLGHGDTRGRLAVALGLGARASAAFGLRAPLAQRRSRRATRSQKNAGTKTKSPAAVVGVVVDDDRRAAEHHGQADPRLARVGELAEQERRGRRRRRRRPPLNPTSRPSTNETAGGEQPDRHGRAEGPAAAAEQRQHEGRGGGHAEPGVALGASAASVAEAPPRARPPSATITISRSRPWMRANDKIRFTARTYSSRSRAASDQSKSQIGAGRARTRPSGDDGTPPRS